jgi:chemotaxis protein CheC
MGEMIKLTESQEDALSEIFNIGVGKAASVLSHMTEKRVELVTPKVEVISQKDMSSHLNMGGVEIASVKMEFHGDYEGASAIFFPHSSALKLVNLLTDEDEESDDFDGILTETLKEVGNIVVNSVLGSLSNILDCRLEYSLPSYKKNVFDKVFEEQEGYGILANTNFSLGDDHISGNIIILLSLNSSMSLLSRL